MADKLKKILSSIMVVLLLMICLYPCRRILERKSSRFKYDPFFSRAKDIDVLFMGSSHVINGIYPMELWKEYGITSYNFGGHANTLPTCYWMLENALDYADPEIVVIDCYHLGTMLKATTHFEYVHQSFDAFPLTTTKVRAVFDLLDDPEMVKKSERGELEYPIQKRAKMDLLWDFAAYHSRWTDLEEIDFQPKKTSEYGAELKIRAAEPAEPIPNPGTIHGEDDRTTGMVYLEKMIGECRDRGIEPVLTFLPFPVISERDWIDANTAERIADRFQVKYINFLEMDLVDFETDCLDADSHLNPSGGGKVTRYLGKYLSEECGAADHRNDPRYSCWDEDYDSYRAYAAEKLSETQRLKYYLMMLTDRKYDFIICAGGDALTQDEELRKFLIARGFLPEQLIEDTDYFFACGDSCSCLQADTKEEGDFLSQLQRSGKDSSDNSSEKDSSSEKEKEDSLSVSEGSPIAVRPEEDGTCAIRIGENKAFRMESNMLETRDRYIKITVFEPGRSEEPVDAAVFHKPHRSYERENES